jgi:hypothetical protein
MKTSVFVINLRSRPDRRREMERELASVGWQASFFEAVAPADAAGFPSTGARGCYLSHLGVLKAADSCAMLIVLEDDLNFCRDFPSRWARAIQSLPKEWAIFYAGHEINRGAGRLLPETEIKGTHFMVFAGWALSRVIDGLEIIKDRCPMPVDGAYNTIRAQNPDLAAYAHFPPLGYQRSSYSDIVGRKWFDVGITHPIVSALRRIKSEINRGG